MKLREISEIATQQIIQKAKSDAEKICAKCQQTNDSKCDIIYT